MAYSVSRRTREFGVRVALGAASGDVLRMILGQGLRTIIIGVALGIAMSLALTRTVASLLFGVTATDPLTLGGVTLLLVGAGAAGVLHSGAAGDDRGSDRRAAARLTALPTHPASGSGARSATGVPVNVEPVVPVSSTVQ